MSETVKKPEAKKENHASIWEALCALQGAMPKFEKNKEFGKPGDSMYFKYAALDSILEGLLPVTSKNGLTVTWEGEGENLQCAIYHTSYKKKNVASKRTETTFDGQTQIVDEPVFEEEGVKRSLPIGVSRKGKMQDIGRDSTYARRYTLCEVLGIAAEEDKDAAIEKESGKNAVAFAFTKAKQGIEGAKTVDGLEKAMKMVEDDVKKLEAGKAPALGLKLEQYNELRTLGEIKYKDLMEEGPQG